MSSNNNLTRVEKEQNYFEKHVIQIEDNTDNQSQKTYSIDKDSPSKINSMETTKSKRTQNGKVQDDHGYGMEKKSLTDNWNKGIEKMRRRASLFVPQNTNQDEVKKAEVQHRRRKQRKLLTQKYAQDPEFGFKVQMDQIKKEEAEDFKDLIKTNKVKKIYSSVNVIRVNIKYNEDFKKIMANEDNEQQEYEKLKSEEKLKQQDVINPKEIELEIKTEGEPIFDIESTNKIIKPKVDLQNNHFGLGDLPWHQYTVPEILNELVVTTEGLSTEEHLRRLEEHGLNQISQVPEVHWLIKFLFNLIGGFQIFLWVGGILCMIAFGINIQAADYQTLALGLICFVVVIGTAVFTQYQEGKSDDVMAALRALTPNEVLCLRNGELQKVLAESLVPGDIVHVKSGEKVPADLRVLSSIDLKVNNASLTGENVDIKLNMDANSETIYEAKNIARMGCNFTSGNGVCIVFATGDTTFFGSIAEATTSIERPDSCLKLELQRFVISNNLLYNIFFSLFLNILNF